MRCSDFSPLVFPSLSKEYLIKSESAGHHKRHDAAQRSFPLKASQLSHSHPEPAVHSRTFAQVRGRTHSQGERKSETEREREGSMKRENPTTMLHIQLDSNFQRDKTNETSVRKE